MKNQKKNNNSVVPLIIIVAVLIGVVGGGYWLYSTSRGAGNNTNRATANSARTPAPPVNAPPGAQPPNMLGSPTASVTIEEFADFQCGSCAAAHPIMKELQSIYGSRIKFVFRNFPLAIPAHDKAFEAALAAEAAGMQGRFWAMQDQLFNNQQAWSANQNYRQLFADYASNIGLDVEKFKADMASMGARNRVEQDRNRGMAMGVNSTPSIFLNGRAVPYQEVNVASLRQQIETELQRAAAANQASPANASNAQAANTNAK